jgi:pseudaminic acid synthase
MGQQITIAERPIGPGRPAYIIAELSANHNQDIEQAVRLIAAAKDVGADAVKLQTYTPDTLTIDSDKEYFRIKSTIWEGQNLYKLYGAAYTPWEWHAQLKRAADDLGIHLFSTPFDATAVELLRGLDVPAYKIASFEVVDLALIATIAATGKPVIMSTGMASLAEIDDAVETLRAAGNQELALLKCTSAYPSPPEAMNLRTIPHMAMAFDVPVGLSDHTMGVAVPVAAVSLGACIIEKHFTLSRAVPGPDSVFSLEPQEFRQMVDEVRVAERSLGAVSYAVTEAEAPSRLFRRSLFVVQDVRAGESFTAENVRSIRPGHGMPPKFLPEVIGRHATRDLERGTPLSWDCVG